MFVPRNFPLQQLSTFVATSAQTLAEEASLRKHFKVKGTQLSHDLSGFLTSTSTVLSWTEQGIASSRDAASFKG